MKHLCIYLILFTTLASAQDSQTFTRDKEFYIRGNTAVIGNNILSKHAKKNFDNTEKVNDEFKMKYVDIDNVSNTYSSSSAYLDIKPTSSIVYAALYWSGTYTGDHSLKRIKDERIYHKIIDERSRDIRQVKLKGSSGAYLDVRGTVIYDGQKARNRSMKSRAPYACMADVTAIVQGQQSGYFTVANVAATQGDIIGGSAAGWLLYLVYEDETQPLQYITTYHGFEFVNTQPVEIAFGNFSTTDSGEVETSITIGAIEGDCNLGKDQVGIFNPKEELFISLDNKVRASSNFFNSTITLNDSIYTKRIPNSANTLGFDIAQIKIPNAQNAIIANNSTGVKMQYNTRSDRFFVFFTAFQTTISSQNYTENKNNSYAFAKKSKPQTTSTNDGNEQAQPSKPIIISQKVEIARPQAPSITQNEEPAYQPEEVVDAQLDKVLNTPPISIPNLRQGYYIISNAFSQIENAQNWITTLESRGMTPQMFFRPENQLFYVFLEAGTDAAQISEELTDYKKQSDLTDSWVLKVNLD